MFTINIHDTFVRAKSVKSQIATTSLKLEVLAPHFGIAIKAHDALSDIEATIELEKQCTLHFYIMQQEQVWIWVL